MRNGFIIGTLRSTDIQEIVKIGRNVIQIYKNVIYRENFKISPFKEVIDKLFPLRQQNKDEGNDLMQDLVKLILNSLHGVQIRKDINEIFKLKSQPWMETEYHQNILFYWNLPNGN